MKGVWEKKRAGGERNSEKRSKEKDTFFYNTHTCS